MMVPTIHPNGSNPDRLVEALLDARGKLDDAIDAMAKTTPNGRDYYPQGPAMLGRALHEHEARVARVVAVQDELGKLAEAIQDAAEGRKA